MHIVIGFNAVTVLCVNVASYRPGPTTVKCTLRLHARQPVVPRPCIYAESTVFQLFTASSIATA